MRLILMGTGAFAVPSFDALLKSRHEVVALVTRPVPPSRGRSKGPVNPVLEAFGSTGLPIFAPANVNDAETAETLTRCAPDLFVVCDYGQLLSSDTLGIAARGGINLHGSLLPKYRGAAPINWALWRGETETGVTVIHMTPRLDGGPCLTCERIDILPDENSPALEHRLAQLGVHPVLDALAMLEHWDGQTLLGTRQDPALASRAPRLKKTDGVVDWTQPAASILNQVRALQPWPGTYTNLLTEGHSIRLILERVSVREQPPAAEPGQVVEVDRDQIVVATGLGCLVIHQVQPAGKRAMATAEFLRGRAVRVGESFSG